MNTKNNPDRFDCFHMAKPNEPVFTLLARDPDAPAAVLAWAVSREERISRKEKPATDLAKVDNARVIASNMGHWQENNPSEKETEHGASPQPLLPYLSPKVPAEAAILSYAIKRLVTACFGASTAAGWNTDPVTHKPKVHNIGERLMLCVSELGEAMEGHRKSLMDDKLPHRPMVEVEMADAIIRICDLAGYMGLDLGGAVVEKMAFNAIRPDHKLENRVLPGGKAY